MDNTQPIIDSKSKQPSITVKVAVWLMLLPLITIVAISIFNVLFYSSLGFLAWGFFALESPLMLVRVVAAWGVYMLQKWAWYLGVISMGLFVLGALYAFYVEFFSSYYGFSSSTLLSPSFLSVFLLSFLPLILSVIPLILLIKSRKEFGFNF